MEATAWQRVAARIARLFFLRVNTRAATQVEGHEEHAAHVEHARAPEHVAQQQAATCHEDKVDEFAAPGASTETCSVAPPLR